MMDRIPSLGFLALLIGAIVLVGTCHVEAQFLIDRDSESWGYPQGGVKLEDAKLTTRVGVHQRFNPAVVAQRKGLTNVKLYIDFPDNVTVLSSDSPRVAAWKQQGGKTYSTDLGAINPGTFVNAYEALHFVAAVPGTVRLAYLISAHEIKPKSGVILIQVQP